MLCYVYIAAEMLKHAVSLNTGENQIFLIIYSDYSLAEDYDAFQLS